MCVWGGQLSYSAVVCVIPQCGLAAALRRGLKQCHNSEPVTNSSSSSNSLQLDSIVLWDVNWTETKQFHVFMVCQYVNEYNIPIFVHTTVDETSGCSLGFCGEQPLDVVPLLDRFQWTSEALQRRDGEAANLERAIAVIMWCVITVILIIIFIIIVIFIAE